MKKMHPSNSARMRELLAKAKRELIEAMCIAEIDAHGTRAAASIGKIAGLVETLEHRLKGTSS